MDYSYLKLFAAATVGGVSGQFIIFSIIGGYTEMILSSIMNVYYASLFFCVGSYYAYKIIKKNTI